MFFRRKKIGPEYYFERGKECLDKGNYQWALESFSKALEFNPDYEMAYYNRAEVYKRLGKTREAVWDYIKFLEVDHRLPGMAEELHEVLKEGINIARMDWQRNAAKQEILSFGITRLLEELIEGYDPEKDYPDSEFYELALSSIEASSPQNRVYTGFIHLLRRDYNKAVKEFDKTIEANPKTPDAYYLRGVSYLGKVKILGAKRSRSMSSEKVKELTELAHLNFEETAKKGSKWRICLGCGYRTSSTVNYCIRCGTKLLKGSGIC
jgi:tetratricopeptide (TPR) repeat protein